MVDKNTMRERKVEMIKLITSRHLFTNGSNPNGTQTIIFSRQAYTHAQGFPINHLIQQPCSPVKRGLGWGKV